VQKRLNNQNKEKMRKYGLLIFLLIALLFILLLWHFIDISKSTADKKTTSSSDSIASAVKTDTTAESKIDTTILSKIDSTLQIQQKNTDQMTLPVKRMRKSAKDSLRLALVADTVSKDSITKQKDSVTVHPDTVPANPLQQSVAVDPCSADTTPLWVYPDPSGGLHRTQLKILLYSTSVCTIQWKFENQSEWNTYTGSPILVTSTSTLQFKATDSCGKQMEVRSEYYEIERAESIQNCPDGMEYIKVGDNKYCIDRYEWPNRKNAVPMSYITKYGASDSCFSVGKRLCNADEWTLACTGPYTWKYPYGQLYERYACSTHDTSVVRSGSKVECRSFFGVYDMAGDLAEWTDTRSTENRNFFYVKGGFWESGPQSSCYDKRYSYYPQNRHNPVGFRCCQDILVRNDITATKNKK
jgi:hypothetical protein